MKMINDIESKVGELAQGVAWLFFFSSRRRHTRLQGDWSSDVCSSDLVALATGRIGSLNIGWGALPSIASRTALLFPTYNEEPHRLLARVQAIYESVAAKIGRASCRERV